jgi:DNA-binding NtrC family response regulator
MRRAQTVGRDSSSGRGLGRICRRRPQHRNRGQRAAAEGSIIRKTLADTNNNRTRAAAALGISRVALYKKLRKHG